MKFKLIVAGSRKFDNYAVVEDTLDKLLENKIKEGYGIVIVSGACDTGIHTHTRPDGTKIYGADGLGERYAEERGFEVDAYPAQWNLYGRYAGPIRNKLMAGVGNAAAVYWDGRSTGSANMISEAKLKDIPTRVIMI